jgi:hypothetical protein
MDRPTYGETERLIDRQMYIKTVRSTDRWIDRQTDRG